MKRMVIKISGSIFYKNRITSTLPAVLDVVKKDFESKKTLFVIVAGGGETARQYIALARGFGGNEGLLDDLGLKAAQLNAELVISYLRGCAYPVVPMDMNQTLQALETAKIVVVGGFHPGHSTNAVAALISERIGADVFINATDVDGVYTADPKKVKAARKLESVTVNELRGLVSKGLMLAGSYELMDQVALNIIERGRIKTQIIRCAPHELELAISGKSVGTLVVT